MSRLSASDQAKRWRNIVTNNSGASIPVSSSGDKYSATGLNEEQAYTLALVLEHDGFFHKVSRSKDGQNWKVTAEAKAVDGHRLADSTDEGTVGSPKAKTDQELDANPKIVEEMSADKTITNENAKAHRMEMTPDQAKAAWEGATKGATHKITACMSAMKGKVDDEGAFCKYLAEQVGYKSE